MTKEPLEPNVRKSRRSNSIATRQPCRTVNQEKQMFLSTRHVFCSRFCRIDFKRISTRNVRIIDTYTTCLWIYIEMRSNIAQAAQCAKERSTSSQWNLCIATRACVELQRTIELAVRTWFAPVSNFPLVGYCSACAPTESTRTVRTWIRAEQFRNVQLSS